MPSYSMPAINSEYQRNYTETDVNKFHRLPYWTAVVQDEVTKDVQVHSKLLGSKNWEPNKGKILRTIIPQATPQLRQFLRPKALESFPRVDTVNPGQRELTDFVFEHMFATDLISWMPSFYDLLQQHENLTRDLARKVALFPELVARTYVYHQARFMMFCGRQVDPTTPSLSILGRDVVLAQQGTGEEADNDPNPTTGKTLAWLKPFVLQMGNQAGLSLAAVHRAVTFMAQQNMGPYKGMNNVGKDLKIPDDQYLLVLGTETNAQWIFDPLVRGLSGLNANLLDGNYTRPMLNRVITRTENNPIRYKINGTTKDLSIPAPETTILTGENQGQTVPNQDYLDAELEVAFLYSGVNFGNAIKVGPPPSAFAKNGPSGNFAKLSWNGEIITYCPNMIQFPDGNGGLQLVENRDKRYMQMFANVAGGVQGIEKRACMPIIFYRNIGVSSNIILPT